MRFLLTLSAVVATALTLTACSVIERTPVAQGDDDAYCQKNAGAQGTKEYAECLRVRDAQSGQSTRMDKAHRRNAEQMLLGR